MIAFRILVYEGAPDWVLASLAKRYVKGTVQLGLSGQIREIYLETMPETAQPVEVAS